MQSAHVSNVAHQILSNSMPLALLRYVLDWILGELEVESLDGVPDVRHVGLRKDILVDCEVSSHSDKITFDGKINRAFGATPLTT